MDPHTRPPKSSESTYIERGALTGFSHAYTTSLSQGDVLGAASGRRKGKENLLCKDRGLGEEALSAWVQVMGHSEVTSFR